MSKELAQQLKDNQWIFATPTASRIFSNIFGGPLEEGDIFIQPQLATTLEFIANSTADSFYLGEIASSILSDLQAIGSIIQPTDFEIYRSLNTDALLSFFQGFGVLSTQPSSGGGLLIAEVLNILERYNLPKSGPTVSSTHLYLESLKQAFRDVSVLSNGSPTNVDPSTLNGTQIINSTDINPTMDPEGSLFLNSMTLVSKVHASSVRPRIFPGETFDPSYYGTAGTHISSPKAASSVVVVDAFHNAVSLVTSLSGIGGSRVFSPSTGIFLNNALAEFQDPVAVATSNSTIDDPEFQNLGSNFLAPIKRPLSSISPVILLRDSEFLMAIAATPGSFDGTTMITATLEAILDTLAFDFNLPQTIRRFRIHHQLVPNVVFVEKGYPASLVNQLSDRGHNVTILENGKSIGSLVLVFSQDDGNLSGIADKHIVLSLGITQIL